MFNNDTFILKTTIRSAAYKKLPIQEQEVGHSDKKLAIEQQEIGHLNKTLSIGMIALAYILKLCEMSWPNYQWSNCNETAGRG